MKKFKSASCGDTWMKPKFNPFPKRLSKVFPLRFPTPEAEVSELPQCWSPLTLPALPPTPLTPPTPFSQRTLPPTARLTLRTQRTHSRQYIQQSQSRKILLWLLDKLCCGTAENFYRKEYLLHVRDQREIAKLKKIQSMEYRRVKIYKSENKKLELDKNEWIELNSEVLAENTMLRGKLDELANELSETSQLKQYRTMMYEMSLAHLRDELNHIREELKTKEDLYIKLESKINDKIAPEPLELGKGDGANPEVPKPDQPIVTHAQSGEDQNDDVNAGGDEY